MGPAMRMESLNPWSPLHLQQILDALRSVLIAINREDRVVIWNRAAARVTGLDAHKVLYSRLDEVPVDWDLPLLLGTRDQCRATNTATPIDDFVVARGSERPHTLGATMTPIGTPGAEWAGAVIIASDLTDRRQLEQRLEAVGALAAGLAHEINTPIQWMRDNLLFIQRTHRELLPLLDGFAASARAGTLPAELSEVHDPSRMAFLREEYPAAIQDALDGADRITAIVRAMKEFAHPGQGRQELCDLNHLLDSALVICRHEYKECADIVRDLGEIPMVPCYCADLSMALLNLVVNAAQAIQERVARHGGHGRITLRTFLDGETVQVEIEDDGGGIPEAVRERIFDPFFTTKEPGKGSGQGLPIARTAIVRKHRGTLSFTTHEGVGTTFILRLPVAGEGLPPVATTAPTAEHHDA